MGNWLTDGFKSVYCAIGVDEPGSMCRTYKEHQDYLRAVDAGSFPTPPPAAAPLVPADALKYAPGGSSTSIELDPTTTDPSEVTRQRWLEFYASVVPAPEPDPDPANNTLLWVLGGVTAVLLLSKVVGGRR